MKDLKIPAQIGKKLAGAVATLAVKGDKILIGLSGGPDSVFLTCFLNSLAAENDYRLLLAHLNYRLRGEESDQDESFCRNLAVDMKLPLEVKIADLSGITKTGGNIQAAARKERLCFFDELVRRFECHKIALGHTADDQAETVLTNIFRGCGLAGLSGIQPQSGRMIRPLLGLGKTEILAILEENKIPFRVDSSNLASDYTRNKIRNIVLPQLRTLINPGIESSLQRLSVLAREASDYFERKTAEFLANEVGYSPLGSIIIPLDKFMMYEKIQKLYLLKSALSKLLGTSRDITGFDLLDCALKVEKAETGWRADLGGGIFIEKAVSDLIIFRPTGSFDPQPVEFPGKTILQDFDLVLHSRLEQLPVDFSGLHDNREIFLDADKLRGDMHVRQFREGDGFQPLGMTGTKKMSDFFIDKKIPHALRREVPLLECGGQIVWVIGEAVSELFRIDSDTLRPMKLWVDKVVKNGESES